MIGDNMATIQELRKRLDQSKASRQAVIVLLEKKEKELETTEQELLRLEKARKITQLVAKETQKKIEYHISNLVSRALASVFPDPYEFVLRFEERRNKIEADLLFKKNGKEADPESTAGGGALDIASFALRIAVWSIKPTRNIMILDEPGKYLSRDLQPKFSEMIKQLSTGLKLQFLIVSHIIEVTKAADRIFEVKGGTIWQGSPFVGN